MPRTPPQPATRLRTDRRRLLVGGAAAATAIVAGRPASADTSASSEGESSTTSTEPAPTPTTSDVPSTGDLETQPTEPTHGDLRSPTTNRAFGTLLSESPDKGIMWPLLGRPNDSSTWTDTYGACRDGCSRRHQGQDLLAPQMTKLLACVSGTIVELRHGSGGNSLYIQGDDGWFYCYLHMNDETPGTHSVNNRPETAWGPRLRQFAGAPTAARGFRVERGEHVAYVGDSGNAEGTYHLHFEIRRPAEGSFSSETQRLWSSASVNARESLRNAQPAQEGPSVDPAVFTPWTTAEDLIQRQYPDFLGRSPAQSNLTYWGGLLNSGSRTPQSMMAYFLESDESDDKAQCVARLYRAFFRRDPDHAGLVYWMDKRRRGMSVSKIAENFVRVPEFGSMYGQLDDPAFVDLVYENVLGRAAGADDQRYWTGELARGLTRGRLMAHFSESQENRLARRDDMDITVAFAAMLKRAPSVDDRAAWSSHLAAGGSRDDMVHMIRFSGEYADVVGR